MNFCVRHIVPFSWAVPSNESFPGIWYVLPFSEELHDDTRYVLHCGHGRSFGVYNVVVLWCTSGLEVSDEVIITVGFNLGTRRVGFWSVPVFDRFVIRFNEMSLFAMTISSLVFRKHCLLRRK